MSDRIDLREIARAVLNDLPQADRVQLMTEMLVSLDGDRGLELLSKTRAAVSLRMQEIIDARWPLHDLAEVYGDAPAVHARLTCVNGGRQ